MDENTLNNRSMVPEGLAFGVAWIVTIAATIVGYAPLLLTFFLISFVGATLVYRLWPDQKSFRERTIEHFSLIFKSPLTCSVLAFAAYIALSSLWSAEHMTALSKAALIVAIVFACDQARYLATTTSQLQLYRINRGIFIGLLLALAFPILELATNLSILNTLSDIFPKMIKTTSEALPIPSYYLNKSVSALGMFFWPALMVIFIWDRPPWSQFLKFSLIVAIASATFLSQSETAKAALVFGAFAFLIAKKFPRPLHIAAQTMWIMAFVLTLPLVMVVHWSGMQNSSWLPYSASDRIHIWNYTAKKVIEHPVLGIGVRSSRSYKQSPQPVLRTSDPTKLHDRQGWHSHNIFLQIWYELGAVGVAFLLSTGLFLLQRIKELAPQWQPFAYAAFASFGTTAAFGYGIWQSWLLSNFGWTVIFFIFALQYAKPDNKIKNPE